MQITQTCFKPSHKFSSCVEVLETAGMLPRNGYRCAVDAAADEDAAPKPLQCTDSETQSQGCTQ